MISSLLLTLCTYYVCILINPLLINRNKAVLEWNKKHWAYTNFKTNEVNCSVIIKGSNKLSLKTKYGSVSSLKSKDIHQDIPTIESNALNKKIKWNSPTIECK